MPADMQTFIFSRDGKEIKRFETENDFFMWYHKQCFPYSYDWAIRHEGYSLTTIDSNN